MNMYHQVKGLRSKPDASDKSGAYCWFKLLPQCFIAVLVFLVLSDPALAAADTITAQAGTDFSYEFSWDEDIAAAYFFDNAVTTYNKDLDVLSLVVSQCADNPRKNSNENITVTAADNIVALLSAMQFNNINQWLYDKSADNTEHTTGYTYGEQKVTVHKTDCNGENCSCEQCTLIPVVIRAGGSSGAWISNFDILSAGDDGNYNGTLVQGFTNAALTIFNDEGLRAVIDNAAANGHYIVWITGHSRAAGTGNYLARLLNETYGTEHVVAYTSATPLVARDELDYGSINNNIFNIINPEDLVTELPFSDDYENWGFDRYGTDLRLFTSGAVDTAVAEKVAAAYTAFTGDAYYSYGDGGAAVRDVVSYLYNSLAPTAKDYYETEYKYYTVSNMLSLISPSWYTTAYETTFNLLANTIADLFAAGGMSDQYQKMFAATLLRTNDPSPYRELMVFALQHGAGITDVTRSSLLSFAENPVFDREVVVAHKLENYLAWLVSGETNADIIISELPDASAFDTIEAAVAYPEPTTATPAADSDNGAEWQSLARIIDKVQLSGNKCFYDDLCFAADYYSPASYLAELPAGNTSLQTLKGYGSLVGYELGLTSQTADLTQVTEPYGEVVVELSELKEHSSDQITIFSLNDDGSLGAEIPLTAAADNGILSFAVRELGHFVVCFPGFAVVTAERNSAAGLLELRLSVTNTSSEQDWLLHLASYDTEGRMIDLQTKVLNSGTVWDDVLTAAAGGNAARIKIMLTGSAAAAFSPQCPAYCLEL